jgi:hypothetical protein
MGAELAIAFSLIPWYFEPIVAFIKYIHLLSAVIASPKLMISEQVTHAPAYLCLIGRQRVAALFAGEVYVYVWCDNL